MTSFGLRENCGRERDLCANYATKNFPDMDSFNHLFPYMEIYCHIWKGIAGGDPFRTGFRAMRLAFAAYLVPWAFIFNPGILMIGSPLQIMKTFFFVTLGAISIGVAFEGFLLTELRRWENALLALSGLCIFIPDPITRAVGLAYRPYFCLAR